MRAAPAAPETRHRKTPTTPARPASAGSKRASAEPLAVGHTWAFGPATGLRIQRKCACGGTCPTCREEEQTLRVQRKPEEGESATSASPAAPDNAAASATAEAQGLLVEDDAMAGAGQMARAAFLAALRGQLLPICDDELAAAGRNSQGCPYLTYWLAFAETRSAAQLERGIRRFTGTPTDTAEGLIEAVVSRVRAAIRLWVVTGQVATPKGLNAPAETNDPGATFSGLVQALFGEGTTASPPAAVQTKALPGGTGISSSTALSPTAVQHRLGAGRGLESGLRSRMEQGFGRSFADVRVHTDPTASSLATRFSARAFTVGRNVAFQSGEYRPGSLAGDLLIAHELAHTVQQQGATREAQRPLESDQGLEHDADHAAVGVVGSLLGFTGGAAPAGQSGLRLQRCSQEVRKRCPKGYSWRVERTMGWGSFGCTCFWKCLPGEPPGRSSTSSGPAVRCPPDRNCSTGVKYEDLGDDYEKKGHGAALTPMGQPAYCGCFPLNFEGEQVSNAPLARNDFELTDVAGPLADKLAARKGGKPIVDPRTGQVIPGKSGGGTPQVQSTKAPAARYTTKPMLGMYKGEHVQGNPIWQGKTVKYLTDAERTAHQLTFKDGKIHDADGNLFDTSAASSLHSGGGKAIFVMDSNGNFFASKTHAQGEFHHSSLAAGQPVAAAGELVVQNGVLKGITDRSGHYHPTRDLTDQALNALEANGIDLRGVQKSFEGKAPTQ